MDSKTHFVITFVSLVLLGAIVIKPEGMMKNSSNDFGCRDMMGKMECQNLTLDSSSALKVSDVQ